MLRPGALADAPAGGLAAHAALPINSALAAAKKPSLRPIYGLFTAYLPPIFGLSGPFLRGFGLFLREIRPRKPGPHLEAGLPARHELPRGPLRGPGGGGHDGRAGLRELRGPFELQKLHHLGFGALKKALKRAFGEGKRPFKALRQWSGKGQRGLFTSRAVKAESRWRQGEWISCYWKSS